MENCIIKSENKQNIQVFWIISNNVIRQFMRNSTVFTSQNVYIYINKKNKKKYD